MRFRFVILAVFLGFVVPSTLVAQDFGLMNSAETITRGNYKLLFNPIVVFGEGNADNDTGIALGGGYGFTDNFDVEVRVAFFDRVTFIGADAELWVVKDRPMDVSVIGGLHAGRQDGFDTTAFDFTLLGSGEIAPRLELYGGLDFARVHINDSDYSFTTAHLVPGIEYAISPKVDLDVEVGLGLNDDSRNYFSAGLAFYFQ